MMKYFMRLICCSIVEMLCIGFLFSQEPAHIRECAIPSMNEHDSIRFGIVLPPSYGDITQQYPVIYYLHGLRDEYTGLLAQKIAGFFKDQFEKEHLPESILVFPDGEEGFWGDHYDGDPLLETEIVKYLIPNIDQSYNTDQRVRLIIGWSAGGFGALTLFTKYPELFKAAISLDGSLVTWREFLHFEGERADITGNDSVYYYEYCSPFNWVIRNATSLKQKHDTALFLSASFFIPMHQGFINILEEQEIPAKYLEVDCDHDFECVLTKVGKDLVTFILKGLSPP